MRAPLVPARVLDAVVEHAMNQRKPERESVGMVVLEGATAVGYRPLRNWARGDYRFRTHGRDERRVERGLSSGQRAVLVHSHPPGCFWFPSVLDLSELQSRWLGHPYGILCMGYECVPELLWFVIEKDEHERTWRALD